MTPRSPNRRALPKAEVAARERSMDQGRTTRERLSLLASWGYPTTLAAMRQWEKRHAMTRPRLPKAAKDILARLSPASTNEEVAQAIRDLADLAKDG